MNGVRDGLPVHAASSFIAAHRGKPVHAHGAAAGSGAAAAAISVPDEGSSDVARAPVLSRYDRSRYQTS